MPNINSQGKIGMKNDKDKILTARRGFFRQLMVQALEGVEQVGRDFASKRLPQFNTPVTTPYQPPTYDNRRFSPQFMVYGPPWPPPYGPHVSIELSRKLRAERENNAEALKSIPRD